MKNQNNNPKHRTSYTKADIDASFYGGRKVGNKKVKQIINDLNVIKDATQKGAISDLAKQIISASNKQVNCSLEEMSNLYVDKAVFVNPLSKEEELMCNKINSVPFAAQDSNVSLVNKNYVYGFTDTYNSSSSMYRMVSPFNMINERFGHTNKIHCIIQDYIMTQEEILPIVRAFWFHCPLTTERLSQIRAYKNYQERYQYKLIVGLDDDLFDMPEWNNHVPLFVEQNTLVSCCNLVDEVVVSTEALKNVLKEVGVSTKITVIENHISKGLFATDSSRYIESSLRKPSVLIYSSDNHSGDFESIKHFLTNRWNEYSISIMGVSKNKNGSYNLPDYLIPLVEEGKIKVYPKFSLSEYAYALRNIAPNFIVTPLVDCAFNRCKSDIAMITAFAVGALFIGQKFEDDSSPYDKSNNLFKDSGDLVVKLSDYKNNPEKFNDELAMQYSYLNSRWMDNTNNLLNYIKIFSDGIKGVSIPEENEAYDNLKDYLDENGYFCGETKKESK